MEVKIINDKNKARYGELSLKIRNEMFLFGLKYKYVVGTAIIISIIMMKIKRDIK
jgi:hypothetical protein